MRLTTLSALFGMLQLRLGETQTQSFTQSRYYQLLSDKQQWLAGAYDWPFLDVKFDATAVAQGRYVAFPTQDINGVATSLNMERPLKVEVKYNNLWTPLEYGISSEEYNITDSDENVYQDPIQRWQWNNDDTGAGVGRFEVWPVPESNQTIRFTGQRVLRALSAGTDKAELDDQVLVLSVAADLLARNKQQDAQIMMQLASERLRSIRAMYPCRPDGFNLGGGEADDRQAVQRIAIASR